MDNKGEYVTYIFGPNFEQLGIRWGDGSTSMFELEDNDMVKSIKMRDGTIVKTEEWAKKTRIAPDGKVTETISPHQYGRPFELEEPPDEAVGFIFGKNDVIAGFKWADGTSTMSTFEEDFEVRSTVFPDGTLQKDEVYYKTTTIDPLGNRTETIARRKYAIEVDIRRVDD